MNCYYHAEVPAAAFCRSCGRPLCRDCQRLTEGTVFCPEHAPVANASTGTAEGSPNNPYFQASPTGGMHTSPALAFGLGWIPGVGAIYNGQYIKGLIHAIIFGLIISLLSSSESGVSAPFFGILLAVFVFYMPFEAYHTAKQRQAGLAVDEWSSFAPAAPPGRRGARSSIGPIVLIGIGVLFLLDTMDLINFRTLGRFWPVLLIAAGVYMLYSRTVGRNGDPSGLEPPPYSSPDSTTAQGVGSDYRERVR